eukprot:m.81885 g.81885  ORF g.81885 m.81885 type:complete len:76 (-) comp14706_c0_seq3:33-260(-)
MLCYPVPGLQHITQDTTEMVQRLVLKSFLIGMATFFTPKPNNLFPYTCQLYFCAVSPIVCATFSLHVSERYVASI